MRPFRRDSSRDKESGHEQHVSTTCCKAAAGSVLIDERAIGNELDRRLVSRDRLNTAQHRARESARHGTSIRVYASGMRCTSLPCRRAGSRSPSSCRKYAASGAHTCDSSRPRVAARRLLPAATGAGSCDTAYSIGSRKRPYESWPDTDRCISTNSSQFVYARAL